VTLTVVLMVAVCALAACLAGWARAHSRLGKRLRLLEMQLRLEGAWQTFRPPELLPRPTNNRALAASAGADEANKSVNKGRFVSIYKGTSR
jgi:hypothetical protein